MKRGNNVFKHIKTIILTIIIAIFIAVGVYFTRMQYEIARVKTIKTNMSNIALKAGEYINKQKAEGKETSYIGTKLSDLGDDKRVITLIDNSIITEDDCEKYYLLSDEDLLEIGANTENEEESSYIYNYETKEVIISKGYVINGKTMYKLSDMEQEDN